MSSSMSPSSPSLPEGRASQTTLPALDRQAASSDETKATASRAEPRVHRGNQGSSARVGPKTRTKASFAGESGAADRDERGKQARPDIRKPHSPSEAQPGSESPSAGSPPPTMLPGTATVRNLDAALSPKGPRSRLPDSLPMGRFQLMILACAQLSAAVDAYQILSARLLAPPVDHWCRPSAEFAHMSADLWRNVGVPLGSDGRFNQCAVYEQSFGPQQSGLSLDSERQAVPCHDWDYDLAPGVQTMVSRWNLVCDYAWQVTLTRVYQIVGSFVMLPLAGQLSDKVGRRVVINFCVILAMCAGLVVAYAESFVVFVASRMFVGASVSSLRINTLILLFEVATPSCRDLYCCLAQLGLIAGSIVATSLEGGVVDVRVVEVVGIMPTSLLVFCFYAAEESPMWLLATWNVVRAKEILLWMSRVNGVAVTIDMPAVSHDYGTKRAEELRALYRVSVLDLLTNDALRRRVGGMMCVWFFLLFAMHGVLRHTPRHTDVWLVLTAVVPRAAALPAAYKLLRGSSRKAALGMCVALSCCLSFSLALLTLLAPPKNKGVTTLFCELTLSALGMAYTVVVMYSLEMFPTVIRTMAVCTVMSSGRVGAALSTGIDAALQRFHRSAPLFLGALSLVAAQVAVVNLPETKYSRLPNTMYDLEANVVKQVVLDILQNSTPRNTGQQPETSTPERKCPSTGH
ncbi:solute carrier family 22 member 7-like isoform X2 [Dermacentor albipictus]